MASNNSSDGVGVGVGVGNHWEREDEFILLDLPGAKAALALAHAWMLAALLACARMIYETVEIAHPVFAVVFQVTRRGGGRGGVRAGNETKVTRRDEIRDGLVYLVSRRKATRRDEIRDQVNKNKKYDSNFPKF